ncbi:hypothetical protein [Streptomyces sp. NBC_01565]|uniref:hypothetical protein n=1 Tax=unclassified Streptomyces TaxID=2593676 RepID=UPI0022519AD9|nr:hypothetical protein [Streptomyces sp. NBC_01565]MCX4544121.1 hypothetical protein [Streptomyces sp. NBC_01565]
MTEAVTPPSPSPSEPPQAFPPEKPGGAPESAITAADVRDGAAVTLVVGVAGVLLGLLWVWLAPRVQYVSNGEAVFLRNTESEGRIGSDGTFLLLSAGLGALSAVATFLWRRRGGVPLVIGLGLGSCFAALVGWRLGLWLGPTSDLAAAAAKAGKGVAFEAPMQLLAYGVLLAWPMVAILVHLALTAVWGPRDPAPAAWPDPYTTPDGLLPPPPPQA